jgi:hypothetical protein
MSSSYECPSEFPGRIREASQLMKNRACWQTPLHDKELWLSESSVAKFDKAEKTIGLQRSKTLDISSRE